MSLISKELEIQKEIKSPPEECTAIIVTGSAAKNGRSILMKNRDTTEVMNQPIYHPRNGSRFAFIGINTYWAGINEKGLAVINTAMPALATGSSPTSGNGPLNRIILETCESVAQVAIRLNDTIDSMGPNKRADLGEIASCLGVIDRFGAGAFFEVSDTEAYVQYVIDEYDSRANHPRIFPGLASGPSGRDQYALDILDEIFVEQGVISWENVIQKVARHVNHKELGTLSFSIAGEICNPNTVAAIVAVSGDPRYNGKLNCMWGEYGNPPLVGLFLPSIVYAGQLPSILQDFYTKTWDKREYASSDSNQGEEYNPSRVREIQTFTFVAEEYTLKRYDRLISEIPNDLSDNALQRRLQTYITDSVQIATTLYINNGFINWNWLNLLMIETVFVGSIIVIVILGWQLRKRQTNEKGPLLHGI